MKISGRYIIPIDKFFTEFGETETDVCFSPIIVHPF